MWLVSQPVVDLRREPVAATSAEGIDPLQETQLLYGEEVTPIEEQGPWVRVEAPEQPRYQAGSWAPYAGWIPRHAILQVEIELPPVLLGEYSVAIGDLVLSCGSTLFYSDQKRACVLYSGDWHDFEEQQLIHYPVTLTEPEARMQVVAYAKRWLGTPYLWGGRSAALKGQRRGVDCSSLVQLSYSLIGKPLPRDARDQMRWVAGIPLDQAQLGDLLFLPDTKNPDEIGHVMMVAGPGHLCVEATSSSGSVREVPLQQILEERALTPSQVRAGSVF